MSADMTPEQIAEAQNRIAQIDNWFAAATVWRSWMVPAANGREALVDRLNATGIPTEHKHLARTDEGGRAS